jgi:hypothetical protein
VLVWKELAFLHNFSSCCYEGGHGGKTSQSCPRTPAHSGKEKDVEGGGEGGGGGRGRTVVCGGVKCVSGDDGEVMWWPPGSKRLPRCWPMFVAPKQRKKILKSF